ncbi:MAG: hypothetical protein WBV64_04230 [Mycobacterium sp.]|jgi:diaminopimelate decarboxylase
MTNVPAAALADRSRAEWVRAHGISVTAHDGSDLDLVRRHHIRPVQVVYRCGPVTALTHRAIDLGVRRFIVHTAHQMARLDECASTALYLYLDDQAPLMLGDRRLKVIGLHAAVGHTGDADDWVTAAQGLVRRAALLKACGSTVKRIALSGGSTGLWLDDQLQAAAIARAVDEAVCDECDQRQLTRPGVTLAALTA